MEGFMNELLEIIGEEATAALCAYFGGCQIYVPKGYQTFEDQKKRNEGIRMQHKKGVSSVELTRIYHLSNRQIQNILKGN